MFANQRAFCYDIFKPKVNNAFVFFFHNINIGAIMLLENIMVVKIELFM